MNNLLEIKIELTKRNTFFIHKNVFLINLNKKIVITKPKETNLKHFQLFTVNEKLP